MNKRSYIKTIRLNLLPRKWPIGAVAVAFLLSVSGASHAADDSSQTADKPIVAMNNDAALSKTLLNALAAKGPDYKPRTEHFLVSGAPEYTNRLILESSPYLIQHAHNPVNWYPWGSDAFDAAKEQDKPVFLSIGYATCHWCHVMERESFEDVQIAGILNDHFIAVKVDREQLPDIDAMYMTAVTMINGSGGWPMSSWLDDQGRPFYGGTYFPPEHFEQLLTRISDLWSGEKSVLLEQADQVSAAMRKVNSNKKSASAFGLEEIEKALKLAINDHDGVNGGFGGAPKFPRESTLFFLLDQAERSQNIVALNIANNTLNSMANGGIHDHIAGGFHRYAVDSQWLVPHFEKMLYNQAALARNYAQAWRLTANSDHKHTSTRILDYVLREMRSEEGMFFSATDADSEGEEGRFFVWTPEELDELLGDEATLAKKIWNVTGEGSFEGYSIIHLNQSIQQIARTHQLGIDELRAKIDGWSNTLLQARQSREKPLLDNKIITSWNGMMITAFAEGGQIFNRPDYLEAATTAARSLLAAALKDDGSLYRSYFEGSGSIEGTQPDYAFFAEGLIALYDATGEQEWLTIAVTLADEMHSRFWDPKDGAYFMGSDSVAGKKLALRPKDIYDNATPTGNSVAMRILAKLFKRSGEARFESRANEQIIALSGSVASAPAGFYYFLLSANEHLRGESGPTQYAARGHVAASASRTTDTVNIKLRVAPGWHINSDKPNQDYLIPTQLQIDDAEIPNTSYPTPKSQSLSFEENALSLFEGELTISAPLAGANAERSKFRVQLQACNDKQCLPPETITLSTANTTMDE